MKNYHTFCFIICSDRERVLPKENSITYSGKILTLVLLRLKPNERLNLRRTCLVLRRTMMILRVLGKCVLVSEICIIWSKVKCIHHGVLVSISKAILRASWDLACRMDLRRVEVRNRHVIQMRRIIIAGGMDHQRWRIWDARTNGLLHWNGR